MLSKKLKFRLLYCFIAVVVIFCVYEFFWNNYFSVLNYSQTKALKHSILDLSAEHLIDEGYELFSEYDTVVVFRKEETFSDGSVYCVRIKINSEEELKEEELKEEELKEESVVSVSSFVSHISINRYSKHLYVEGNNWIVSIIYDDVPKYFAGVWDIVSPLIAEDVTV